MLYKHKTFIQCITHAYILDQRYYTKIKFFFKCYTNIEFGFKIVYKNKILIQMVKKTQNIDSISNVNIKF